MKITVTEALKELKTLDARIQKATSEPVFAIVAIGGKIPAIHKTEEEFKTKATAAVKSVEALIKRRADIKAAIVKSNAATSVTIDGVVYTVAAAIERKTSIAYEEKLGKYIGLQYLRATREADEHNNRVKMQLDQHITTILGKDAKDKGGKEVDDFSANYMAKNEAKVIDPISCLAYATELGTKIENFSAQVDTKLSISNAITEIEIPE